MSIYYSLRAVKVFLPFFFFLAVLGAFLLPANQEVTLQLTKIRAKKFPLGAGRPEEGKGGGAAIGGTAFPPGEGWTAG